MSESSSVLRAACEQLAKRAASGQWSEGQIAYEIEAFARRQQQEALRAVEQYLQHRRFCGALVCGRCLNNLPESNYVHQHTDNIYYHKFVAAACTCGLDKARADADPHLKEKEKEIDDDVAAIESPRAR